MNIVLVSAISGIPTKYPFEGYGGIERIVGDLAHELHRDHFVQLVAQKGSHIASESTELPVIELNNENEVAKLKFDDADAVIDFSHTKQASHSRIDAFSVPFWSDALGPNPIFPTDAVRWSFGKEKWATIYPGIDLTGYHSAKKQDYFIYLGRIAPYKGTHFAVYLAKKYGFNLKVVGHTGQFSNDKPYIEMVKNEADSHVEFIGDVPEKQKIELLSHAKGLIMPSNWSILGYGIPNPVESFGITAVESLACGTPVFTNDMRSGIREIITPQTGRAFSLNDWGKMLELKFKEKDILKRAQFFSVKRYAQELVKYVDGLIDGN